jgi:hypothetical protein
MNQYYNNKQNQSKNHTHTNDVRENFAFLSDSMLKDMNKSNMTIVQPQVILNNFSNGQRMAQPQYQIPIQNQVQQIRSPDADNQVRLLPTMSANLSNTYNEAPARALNTMKEPGNRDPQAGIQYYTPFVGVNRKTMMEPIIAPRITDQDIWGKQSTVRSNINKLQIVDITNEAINTNDMAQIPEYHPDAQGYKYSYPLGIPVAYENRVPNGVWNMNPVGQDPDIGYYPSGEDMYNSQNSYDFQRNYVPLYQNPNSYVAPKVETNYMTNPQTQPFYQAFAQPIVAPLPITQWQGVTQEQVDLQEDGVCTSCNGKPPTIREGFSFLENDKPTSVLPNTPIVPRQVNAYMLQPPQYPLTTQFSNQGEKGLFGGPSYDKLSRVPPGQNAQIPAVTTQLMYQSPVYNYTDAYFQLPNNRLFLQNIQPSLYSYAVDQQPINSSVGIAYAPQKPPRVLDQITNAGLSQPLYSRVDPQLIRTDGTPGQQSTQPTRTDWSAEYSNFQAPPGSINFEDIYDPRFTSYGDPYRSYSDVNLGQVQYYYSDVDNYRMPNFISRSNVDFVDFRNPQGQIWPEYARNASIDDVRPHVENQVTADELFHREDMMSLQMDKINRERWQTRFAPLNTNNSFTV